MVIVIQNGELFAPAAAGKADLLVIGNLIEKVGNVDLDAIERLDLETEVIDATDCFVVPGFIDPHEHLLGGSGEEGFSSQTPEIQLTEIVSAGITTVVGCLGVDTTMKTMPGLLARAKALKEEGLSAYIWSGGYNVPPTTITNSIRNDIMFIEEVIGAGEIAIADERSTGPKPRELARIATDAYVGGMLSRKAGVTHFHVGDGKDRLKVLDQLLTEFHVRPEALYATHIGRNEQLMDEAIELTGRGCFVDIDTVEEDLQTWLQYFVRHGGDQAKLTVSSDAGKTSPANILNQIRECLCCFRLEELLPLLTTNTASILKLHRKAKIGIGSDADVLILDRESFQLREVIAGGRRLFKNGHPAVAQTFIAESNRRIEIIGKKSARDKGGEK
jgi:beta-aspartyl-dipeptidase (metallo-type)